MEKSNIEMMEQTPENINPIDDAFHGSSKRRSAEWWYFDVIFDNGYTTHIGCMTFSKKNRGTATQVLELYKDGKLVFEKRKKNRFSVFETSKKIPYVKISGKPFIKFDEETYKKTGKWIYDVSIKLEKYELNLKFIGTTKGWKIETDRESWTVALPKAEVTGELIIDQEKIDVKGIGYHDHNWNYNLKTLLTYGKGWYWGRVMSKRFNVIFANIFKSSSKSILLSIINEDKKGYLSIKPESIDFRVDDFISYKRKKIPSKYFFKINDVIDNVKVEVDVEMSTNDIHYQRRLLILSYYRFHVKSKGYISIDNVKENVNDLQIVELMKLR